MRTSIYLVAALTLLSISNVVAYQGIGDRLLRTFLVFHQLPLNTTMAEGDGWEAIDGTCNPSLGVKYTQNSGPIYLYYTQGGQIAGVGIQINDEPPAALVPDFWKPTNDSESYEITLSFRQASVMCSDDMQPEEIGDSLTINADTIGMPIGLNVEQATNLEWTPGHCISEMGTHWAYDTQDHPLISHQVANLVPIMPMYNDETGNLSAFLVHITHIEKVEPFGVWEGPFIPLLFCQNLCPPCNFDTFFFSTMHFMLTDPKLNVCQSSCGSAILA